jgi:hypothetical protein
MTRALGSSGARGIFISPDARPQKESPTESQDVELESLLSGATVCQKLSGIESHLSSIVRSMNERDTGLAILSHRISNMEAQHSFDVNALRAQLEGSEKRMYLTVDLSVKPLKERIFELENKTLWQRIFRWR